MSNKRKVIEDNVFDFIKNSKILSDSLYFDMKINEFLEDSSFSEFIGTIENLTEKNQIFSLIKITYEIIQKYISEYDFIYEFDENKSIFLIFQKPLSEFTINFEEVSFSIIMNAIEKLILKICFECRINLKSSSQIKNVMRFRF